MKVFFGISLLLAVVTPCKAGELVWGEFDRKSPRVSLMKVIIDPESCKDMRVRVFGHFVLSGNSGGDIYFSKESLENIDVGNAVRFKADGVLKFLEEKKANIRSSSIILDGFVRYRPKVKNIEARIHIDAKGIVFMIEDPEEESE